MAVARIAEFSQAENGLKVLFNRTTKAFLEMKEKIKSKLDSPEKTKSFSDIENSIAEMGRELMRTFCEEIVEEEIDKVTLPPEVEDSQGNMRSIFKKRDRHLKTQFGTIKISRNAVSLPEKESIFTEEHFLELPDDTVSFGFARLVAEESVNTPMDRLIPKVKATTGEKVSKGKLISILEESSTHFDSFYSQEITSEEKDKLKESSFIVASFDGKGVPLKKEETKSLENTSSTLSKPKVLKSHTGKKKMATVASVHNSDSFMRTPIELHKTLLGEIRGVHKQRPKPIHKRVWASLEKPASEVISEGFKEVNKRDPQKEKELVVVIDGAEHQKKQVLDNCKKSGRKSEIIIDIVHAVEYLWKAARVFFPEQRDYQAEWVREKQLKLLEGGAKGIAKGIKSRAKREELEGKQYELALTAAGYLSKNWKYMRYNVFLEKGYPIGSGVIEGTCRSLIGDRLEITGAHWTKKGAESILKLRALALNGDFDRYWNFYVKQEVKNRRNKELSKKFIEEHLT